MNSRRAYGEAERGRVRQAARHTGYRHGRGARRGGAGRDESKRSSGSIRCQADVTPLGNDDTVKLTVPVKPFTGVVVIVVEPPLGSPCVIDTLVGAAARLKFGTGEPVGQLLTRFAALTVPIPVAKSQPVVARNAGLKELLDVERTPNEPAGS